MVETSGKLTLWGIEVFAAVAEERSVSAAAGRLGASPSAVSQQLANLEAALGTQLVDRSARPFALTPAGTLLRRRAETIINEAAAARAELSSHDLSQLGRLSLGVIEDFDAEVTPRLLDRMGDRLKGTGFLLETGASHRLYDLFEARTLDIIVATESEDPADWMDVHPLLEEPFVAVFPKGQTNIEALPLIHYTTRHLMGRQIARHLVREGCRFESRFEIDSYVSIMAMVARGAGWSVLTPLGALCGGSLDGVELADLPTRRPLSRRISLMARKESFYEIPGEIAEHLRGLLATRVVSPASARWPWLGDRLRVL